MDTYFHTNHKCVTCGKCVDACPQDFLYKEECLDYDGEAFTYIGGVCEYVPCHRCDGFWENTTPCQKVCEHNAIEISRW